MQLSCASGVHVSPDEELIAKWRQQFGNGWDVQYLLVESAVGWGGKTRMAFGRAMVIDPAGQKHQVAVFLRGATVDILPILEADGIEYVVLVEQARVPVGQIVISTPAGMIEGPDVAMNALRELAEETDIQLQWSTPRWLNNVATGSDQPMLVSPGGTDETVQFCTVRATISTEKLVTFQDRAAGLAEEGEHTTVHIVPVDEALNFLGRNNARPDLKTVLSLMLYERSRS